MYIFLVEVTFCMALRLIKLKLKVLKILEAFPKLSGKYNLKRQYMPLFVCLSGYHPPQSQNDSVGYK